MLPPDFTASMAAFIWVSVHTFLLVDRLDGDFKMAGADFDCLLLVSRFLCLERGIPTIEGYRTVKVCEGHYLPHVPRLVAENTTPAQKIGPRKRM